MYLIHDQAYTPPPRGAYCVHEVLLHRAPSGFTLVGAANTSARCYSIVAASQKTRLRIRPTTPQGCAINVRVLLSLAMCAPSHWAHFSPQVSEASNSARWRARSMPASATPLERRCIKTARNSVVRETINTVTYTPQSTTQMYTQVSTLVPLDVALVRARGMQT